MKQGYDTLDILYAYLSPYTSDTSDTLLDDWTSEVIENGDHGFEKGLLGLGWLIGFLIENDYIEGDADEILEDIDDTIYKLTLKEVLDPEMNIDVLLHYISYYQQRLQYKSKAHFYRRFAHFECMKLLLEKTNSFMLDNPLENPSNISASVNMILKYTYLVKISLNEHLVEEALYKVVEQLICYFKSQKSLRQYEEEIAKLHIAVRQYENPYWEEKLKVLLDKVISGNETENVWISFACCDIWQQEHVVQIAETNGKDKFFLLHALTNVKTNVRSI